LPAKNAQAPRCILASRVIVNDLRGQASSYIFVCGFTLWQSHTSSKAGISRFTSLFRDWSSTPTTPSVQERTMPDTLIKVDLAQSPYANEMVHNRWHPDIPMACWVKPGRRVRAGDLRLDRWLHQEQRRADDVRDIDLSTVHYLSGPVGVKGAEPGDLLVVDLLDVGAKPESLWGFNGFFSQEERRRLSHRALPAGAKVDLGLPRSVHQLASRARV
jgi:hypothetical protein